MDIWNARMFELIDYTVNRGDVESQSEFLRLLGFTSLNNMYQIKAGKQSFRHSHFYAACVKFGTSMDWFYGFTNTMKRADLPAAKIDPVKMIKDGLHILESF